RGNGIVYEQLHRRLALEALAEAVGIALPLIKPPRQRDTDRTWLFDMALDQIRESILPHVDHPLAARRTKGVARTLKMLREADRFEGRDLEVQAETRISVLAETNDDATRLLALWTLVSIDNERMRPAMGRFADQHLPPLP